MSKLKQLLFVLGFLALTFSGLHAATKTPENQQRAAFLANPEETEHQWGILSGRHGIGTDFAFVLGQVSERLLGFSKDTEAIIMERMSDRELRILSDFYDTSAGAGFVKAQSAVAEDVAPVVGLEILRVSTGTRRQYFAAMYGTPVPPSRAAELEKLRPLIHDLFEESFRDYKQTMLASIRPDDRAAVESAANRFNLKAVEDAYFDSLCRRLDNNEAHQAAEFFARPEAVAAHKKYASCRRAAICGIFTR